MTEQRSLDDRIEYAKIRAAANQMDLFDESKHPRDEAGKFAETKAATTAQGTSSRIQYTPTDKQLAKWSELSPPTQPTDDEFKERWKHRHHGKLAGWGIGKREWIISNLSKTEAYQRALWQGRVDKARGEEYADKKVDDEHASASNLGYYRGYTNYDSDRGGWDKKQREDFDSAYGATASATPDTLLSRHSLKSADFEITDGYVGGMGKQWDAAHDASLDSAIVKAAEHNNTTQHKIVEALKAGMQVKFAKSPNYEYDHSYAMLRLKDWQSATDKSPVQTEMVKCKCGHTVPKSTVMSASLGSSCPACYDKMSN